MWNTWDRKRNKRKLFSATRMTDFCALLRLGALKKKLCIRLCQFSVFESERTLAFRTGPVRMNGRQTTTMYYGGDFRDLTESRQLARREMQEGLQRRTRRRISFAKENPICLRRLGNSFLIFFSPSFFSDSSEGPSFFNFLFHPSQFLLPL